MKALRFVMGITFLICFLYMPLSVVSSEAKETKTQIPDYVINISKDNTYHSPVEKNKNRKANEMTKGILEKSGVETDNPFFIQLLNKSQMKNAPFAIGYQAKIYLGEWPIRYESKDTNLNWYYQKVNTNYLDNREGIRTARMSYYQEVQKDVKGGITTYVNKVEDVQEMMLLCAEKKTGLPLSFDTIIGGATRGAGVYHVPAKCLGYLTAYVPAVHEEGMVTYAKVYLQLKGNQRRIVLEDEETKKVSAWIPVENHIAFGFDYRGVK